MKKLILVSVVSITTTILILLLVFLPAKYGIDPTGLGAKIGINGLVGQSGIDKSANSNNKTGTEAQDTAEIKENSEAQSNITVPEQTNTLSDTHQEIFNLTIPPKQNLTFKFAMERDYELDYHWATDSKLLRCELRGKKQEAKDNKFKVFGKLKESKAKGFFIAPFNGEFSLFWENNTDQEVKVRLNLKGAYRVAN